MGIFQNIGQWFAEFLDWAGDEIRRITAFLFIFFTIGILVGAKLAGTASPAANIELAVISTLTLAALAYVSTGFAVLLFVIIVLVFFVIL